MQNKWATWTDKNTGVKYKKLGFFTVIDTPKMIDVTPSGYLYLLKIEGSNKYKIGTSKNVISRKISIAHYHPNDIEIIFQTDKKIEWNYHFEKDLHKKWSSCRIKGEWFSFDEKEYQSVIADMIRIQTTGKLFE